MNEKIFTFIAPFLSYIDDGKLFRKPFSWLYAALAAINVVLPFYILYKAIDADVFSIGAKFVFAFLLVWLVVVAACWVGFQIWWDRRKKVLLTSSEGSEFPATPVISHFIQTLGEWLGVWVAIVGFGFSFIAWIFLGEEAAYLGNMTGLPFSETGIAAMIIAPVTGFLIIVIARFVAEQCRALAAIANNTKN
ncbi:MAG: hypothetical protein LBC40_03600 [Dysgonamonadaceae bacterium]|jgi:hypothetical protein|nr:hypothetical protein [Dysgonamonadaceae bacterium]